ncbi:heme exporter protein CcmB [Acetobacteraceae bacterium]|nr:heme exporter protein CcmB [Acetobacteraceae bacterium]
MIFWKSYFLREVKLAYLEGGSCFNGAIQTLLCGILFPLALSASPVLLLKLGPGIIWSCALLGCLIPVDGLFATDLKDGSLDWLACNKTSLSMVAFLKIFATWIVRCLPVLIACALLAIFFNYPFENFPKLLLSLGIGSLIFCFIGGMSSAFIPYGKKGNSLLGLILLPLCMPVIIFGALSCQTIENNPATAQMAFEMLTGLLFLTLPLCTLMSGVALKEQISQY